MATDRRTGELQRFFDGRTITAQSERELLARFVVARDELAFEAIVARHGPMVASVCRSVLANPADVDDAFQATFLVLVRKAGSLRDADHLSPWLHGVARRVALQARAEASRRRTREPLGVAPDPGGLDHSLRTAEERELAALLHAELERLAPPERSAILLCDLEGLTHQEAADQLGWPLGTVKTRVARGRDRLRTRLARRGVSLSTAALAATWASESSAVAVVPRALMVATTRAALVGATGRALTIGLVSAPVLNLTQGAVRAMIVTKMKVGAILLAATTSMLAVPTLVAYQQSPPSNPASVTTTSVITTAEPPQLKPAKAAETGEKPAPTRSPRVLIAERIVRAIAEDDRTNNPVAWVVRRARYSHLVNAEIEAAHDQAGQIKAVQTHLDRLQQAQANFSRVIAAQLAQEDPLPTTQSESLRWKEALQELNGYEGEIFQAQRQLAQLKQSPKQPATAATVGTTASALTSPIAPALVEPAPSPTARVRSLVKTLASDEPRQQAILAKLDERISMPFPNPTPFSDVQKYIEQSTQDEAAGLPTGIPIYVEYKDEAEADSIQASTVFIRLEGIPLRTTLQLLLKQLNLTYVVEGGLLVIVRLDDQKQTVFTNNLESNAAAKARVTEQSNIEKMTYLLDRVVPMQFPNGAPLTDVLKFIQTSTKDAKRFPFGLPIYLDPWDGERVKDMKVTINLEGFPLRTTLPLVLEQLELVYTIKDGLVVIRNQNPQAKYLGRPGVIQGRPGGFQ